MSCRIYESIDFDLSIMATKTGKLSETIESVVSKTLDIKVKDEFDSFDFDFGSNETEVKGIVKIDASAVKEASDNSQLTDDLKVGYFPEKN